jgi:hypothetical protein
MFTLYETDYLQWIQDKVKQLQSREFSQVDWENLINEIESMGKREKRALLSLLTRLLEHLLKLAYWETEKERTRNHWAAEVVNFRAQIQHILEDSPSLCPQLETFYQKAYSTAIKSVSQECTLPSEVQISLEKALDTVRLRLLLEEWFPR